MTPTQSAESLNTVINTVHDDPEPTRDAGETEPAVWERAGAAWGRRAADWATLMEPFGLAAYEPVLNAVGAGTGIRLLDVACGSGLATRWAATKGAEVSGLDASADLIEIARRRHPLGDFRAADMFDLPWADDTFDAATSFNGIWGGSHEALAEIQRVVHRRGRVGLTFFGSPDRMDLFGYFIAIGEHGPPGESEELSGLAEIGRPGGAEKMMRRAGIDLLVEGWVTSVLEWADRETAVRALLSPGVAVPAIDNVGEERFAQAISEAIEPYVDTATGMVRVENELRWVTGEVR